MAALSIRVIPLSFNQPFLNRQKSDIVVVIYRMYDEDPSVASGSSNRTRKQQFWGSAEPAVVERLVPGGGHGQREDMWEEVPPCTDFGAALFQSTFTDLYPVFRHFPVTPASCPMATLSHDLFPTMILFGTCMRTKVDVCAPVCVCPMCVCPQQEFLPS